MEQKISLRDDGTALCENTEDQFTTHTMCISCGSMVKHKMRCHKRFEPLCKHCSKEYRKQWYAKYKKVFEVMDRPKLVTLTLKKKGNKAKRLEELSSLARKCRYYLSRRGYDVEKHLWVMEPPNHIHALWDTGFLPQSELSEIWESITGDSFIVDIRKASNRQGANYLLKYLGKTTEWDELNLEALKGVHITGSWNILADKFEGMICDSCGKRDHVRIEERYFKEFKQHLEYNSKPPP